MKRLWTLAAAGLLAAAAAECGSSGGGGESGGGKVRVATTMSVLQDMTEEVGGDRVEATAIVPTGASVETYQPSPSDAQKISEADLVVQNGLGLEAWMQDLIESAGGSGQPVVELSEGLEPIGGGDEHSGEHAGGDPHLWLDVENAEHYVKKIRDELIEADPEGEEEYRDNAGKYLADLEKLDGYIEERAQEIPEENRTLVTTHEAFPYFAEAYGFELERAIIQNPDAEPGSREVAEVVQTVERKGVQAIFTEPQFNPGLADTIAAEAGVEVEELYSDTLTEDEAGESYEAMMRTNIDRIAESLG